MSTFKTIFTDPSRNLAYPPESFVSKRETMRKPWGLSEKVLANFISDLK